MADLEKVIKALECCTSVDGCCNCPYGNNGRGTTHCQLSSTRDALALLREQKPVEPHVEYDSDDDSWYYGCGACHEAIDYKDKFCRHCGRKVLWGETD